MKITKFVHSCLLLEENGKTILIDPGEYSVKEALSLDDLQQLDYLLITHEHADHFSPSFVKQLKEKFPSLTIIVPPSIQRTLENEQIDSQTVGDEMIAVTPVPHEKVFGVPLPQNILFTVNNHLTHPGDSLHFQTSSEILALPITAPWGSVTAAVEKALECKPKIIIPIHDWHWKDEARKGMYARLTDYFKQFTIDFKGIETGEQIEV